MLNQSTIFRSVKRTRSTVYECRNIQEKYESREKFLYLIVRADLPYSATLPLLNNILLKTEKLIRVFLETDE